MSKCIDTNLGDLIAAYELNQLEKEEKKQFESHLEDCEFCRESLAEMAPVIMDMRNQEGVFSAWNETGGVSFDKLAAKLQTENTKPDIIDIAKKGIKDLIDRITQSDFIELLSFEPFPLPAMVLRGAEDVDNCQKYWLEAYWKGNYKIAIKFLKKEDKHCPDQWETLMFLGICLFLDKQPKPAVKALRKADELSKLAMKEEIRWYLAQALLLKGEKEEALKLLAWLSEQPGKIYPIKSKALLDKLKTS
jgi:hypothetical protein